MTKASGARPSDGQRSAIALVSANIVGACIAFGVIRFVLSLSVALDVALVAVEVACLAVGMGSLWWAHREVARARERAERAERQLAASGIERTLRGGGRVVGKALQTATRVRERGLNGLLSSLDELAGWAEVQRPDLRRIAARNGTVTILFSDIEDSTAINERLGDRAWVKLLTAHDRLVRDRVSAQGGHVVKSQGDGYMVAFSEPAQAVSCAAQIQRALADGARSRLRGEPIRVRIGIHLGKAVEKDGDYFGRNVALAARIGATGEGGQILVSSVVAEQAGELPDLAFVRPQEVALKGLPGPHRILEVQWDPV